jgi:hypothetical protein
MKMGPDLKPGSIPCGNNLLWLEVFCGEGIYPRWAAKLPQFFCIWNLGALRAPSGINPLATEADLQIGLFPHLFCGAFE